MKRSNVSSVGLILIFIAVTIQAHAALADVPEGERQARAFFPVANERDYQMLDDPSEVRRLLHLVNNLLARAERLPADSIRLEAWDVGVTQRRYYVVGAHMARAIDQKLGRQALLQTISSGPLDSVDVYNGLVDKPMQVVTFSRLEHASPLQQLKSAVIHDDRATFDRVAAEMTSQREEHPATTQKRIERLGYGMIYQEAFDWVIAVFQLDVALFPESANSYDCLAEAQLKNGDRGNVIRFYRQALTVVPGFVHAQKMLTEIE